ncbi:MAG: hypothetical protein IJD03_00770 [Clostridia bacterium]|nr:hypothetical protein [Clostridia bacterium]
MQFTLSVDRDRLIKTVLYFLLVTLAYAICGTRGMVWGPDMVTVNPMPFIIAAIAFYEGPYMGGSLGLYAGLLLSIQSHTHEGFEALVLAMLGILCGSAAVMFMRRTFASVMVCGLSFMAVRGIISSIYYQLFYGIPWQGIMVEYLKITFLSALAGAVGWMIVSNIHRRFTPKGNY